MALAKDQTEPKSRGKVSKLRGAEAKAAKEARREAKRQRKAQKAERKAQSKAAIGISPGKASKKRKKSEDHGSVKKKVSGVGEAGPDSSNGVGSHQDHASSGSEKGAGRDYVEMASLTALPQSEIDQFLAQHHITIKDPLESRLRPIIQFDFLADASFATFTAPTPIQASSWPHLLSGHDVVGVAETGSGKTIAFGVPCVRALAKFADAPARAVIVSPTRELASQIHVQLESLAKPYGLEVTCLYGGVPKEMQRFELKTANIIVATPGRLNDLIEEGHADLSQVQYMVLDEADRMLDKGFEAAIRTILSAMPTSDQGRQTCMFTATWPASVRDLAATFMHQPVHISIGADNPTGELRANKAIVQRVEVMDGAMKESRLRDLILQHAKKGRILVFCLYKKEAARVEETLRRRSAVSVAGIHGDMSQPARTASLEAFKSGTVTVLVATDVAARGLDIPSVKLVINVTFPLTVEDYVHRIGRTGRAGADGLAITFFTDHDKGLAGGLVNVLKAANQEVPEALLKYGTTVKKKQHESYGAFYREPQDGEKSKGTMIRF